MTPKPEGFVDHCVHGVILGVCLHCANAALRARLAELETSLAFEKATIAVNKLTIYRLEGQVAALADALVGLTRSVYRCYEHNDALGDAMDLAKAALRATGRKP